MSNTMTQFEQPDLPVGYKTVCIRLSPEDLVGVEIIKAIILHECRGAIRATTTDAIRYALSVCATVARGACPIEECPNDPQAQA